MIVHLIRAKDFSPHTYQSVLQLLQQFPGPITYRPSETENEIIEAIEQEIANRDDFETGDIEYPQATLSAREYAKNDFFDRIKVNFPLRRKSASWDSFFLSAENTATEIKYQSKIWSFYSPIQPTMQIGLWQRTMT